MEIIHYCPSKLATGGTEGIHHLVSELIKCGADAKILYVGDLDDPQPKEFEKYGCPWITHLPYGYKGVVIFPEVWGNQVIEPMFNGIITVINWQGVDVYYWNNQPSEYEKFLKNPRTIHLTMSEYGMEHLKRLGLSPYKVPDCINEYFTEPYDTENYKNIRENTVLYNPVPVKLTNFQETVMQICTTELGIRFKPLRGYSREELRELFRRSKLYIDFGLFSGRERLPREAVMNGCCILTSNTGTARYYLDNAIPRKYRITDVREGVNMVRDILSDYEKCAPDFDNYRLLMREDQETYPTKVKEFYDALLNHYTGSSI